MGIIMEIAIGICLITLVSGAVAYVLNPAARRRRGIEPDRAGQMEARLAALEQRVTELQDVMIAIDDKLGRMEVRAASPAAAKSEKG